MKIKCYSERSSPCGLDSEDHGQLQSFLHVSFCWIVSCELNSGLRICTVCFLLHFLSYFEGLVFPVVVVNFASPLCSIFPASVDYWCGSPVSCSLGYISLPCSWLLAGLSLYLSSLTSCGPFFYLLCWTGFFSILGFLPAPCGFGCLYLQMILCRTDCPFLV